MVLKMVKLLESIGVVVAVVVDELGWLVGWDWDEGFHGWLVVLNLRRFEDWFCCVAWV